MAGVLIASFGTRLRFLLNAALSLAAGFVIMRWRLEPKSSVLPGERFFGAMRVGFQYVAQSTSMRSVLLRVAIFFLQSTALLGFAAPGGEEYARRQRMDLHVLLASLGLGAIATAFLLPRLRVLITRERLLRDGTLVQAVAMVVVGFAPNVWSAMPAMMLAGAAWLAVVNTLTVAVAAVTARLGARPGNVALHDDDDGGHLGQCGAVGPGCQHDRCAVDICCRGDDRDRAVAVGPDACTRHRRSSRI